MTPLHEILFGSRFDVLMPLDPTQRYITSIASNGIILAVGLADYRVELFDLNNMEKITTLTQDLWEVKSVHIDDKLLLISSLNENVQVYTLSNLNRVASLSHPLGVLKMWTDDKYIYTTSYNKEVWLWDKTNFDHVSTLSGHSVRVNCVISNEQYIFTGDGFTIPNAMIRVWDKSTKALLNTINSGSYKRINHLIIYDNLLISAQGSPGVIEIRDLSSLESIASLDTGSDCTSFDINQNYIIGAVKDHVCLWNRSYGLIKKINENEREVTSVVLDGNRLIYGSRNTLKVYNIQKDTYELEMDL